MRGVSVAALAIGSLCLLGARAFMASRDLKVRDSS
jgi:hypothetical protein